MKYNVIKTNYTNDKELEDYGEMTIEELREFAKGYIGDVFDDEAEIDKNMEYIKESGEENRTLEEGYTNILIYRLEEE